MSTITQTVQPATDRDGPMSIDEYEKLVETGALTARDKVQLIDGMLVPKMVQNPPHSVANVLCGGALARAIPRGGMCAQRCPSGFPPNRNPSLINASCAARRATTRNDIRGRMTSGF
jgi:hypothetical protein